MTANCLDVRALTAIEVFTVATVLALAAIGPPVWAHGDGLNSEGCHNNRKTGDYHYHRPLAGTSTAITAPSPATLMPLQSLL